MAFSNPNSLSTSTSSASSAFHLRLQPQPFLHLPTLPFHRSLPLHLPALRLTRPLLPPLPLASSGGGSNFGGGGGGDDDLPSGGGGGGDDDEDENEGEGGDDDASVNRREALFVLAQLGRKLESLPADMAAAVDGGRLPGEIVRRFADLEKSPLFRWLLQFGGFRERLLADDLFLAKVAMECGVGIFTKDFQETTADPTNGRVPKLGMQFISEEEAYSFYNKYAETIGFSIRRSSGHKVKNSSKMQQRTFTCSRQGFRGDDKREDTFSYSRPETQCGILCWNTLLSLLKEQLAQDVEKSLKIRSDPELGNSCTTLKNIADPEVGDPSTTEGLNIDSSRISKHNQGLAKPKGIKFKEKTTKGSTRPVGGFEKATSKKKKNKGNASQVQSRGSGDTTQVQPHGTSTDHLELFTNQMAAYQLHYNTMLNAPMPPSIGNTNPMSVHPQELLAGFQPYNTPMGHPSNHAYTYLPQQNNVLNPSLQGNIGIGTSSAGTAHNYALNPSLQGNFGIGTSTAVTGYNYALSPSLQGNICIGTSGALRGQNYALNPTTQETSSAVTGQNYAFLHQEKPTE